MSRLVAAEGRQKPRTAILHSDPAESSYSISIGDEDARIINHGTDEAVREAVMAFAEQQALMRKEQEDDHLAFIAHDLRTPLNAVSLLVDELKEGMEQIVEGTAAG